MTAPAFVTECPPPWVAFPALPPDELGGYLTQGATEAWFDQQWRPFWSRLQASERAQYLDHWKADDAWRDALRFHFADDPSLDLVADEAEAKSALEGRSDPPRKVGLFARLFGVRRKG